MSSLTLDGAPLDPAASYRVTVPEFLADGGDGFAVPTAGTDRLVGPTDVDALVAYLGRGVPVSPPPLDRITLVP